ncbi:MAG TPA: hypothetical protein VKN35_12025, partial [Xanthomonadales bacterium]|nr:hypothetical protein [Xanthomonadales bacterium]
MRKSTRVSRVLLSLYLAWGSTIFTAAFAGQGYGGENLKSPNWDRHLALGAVSMPDVRREASRMIDLTLTGSESELLDEMNELATMSGWAQPEAEAVIYEFIRQLRPLPPYSVNQAVVDFVVNYQPQVLVPHEESMSMGVPLFPIRAAAAGLVNQWTREQAEMDARILLVKRPSELLAAYADSADPNNRAGIESSLADADPAHLDYLLQLGLPLLAEYPGLTSLLGKAAIVTGNVQSISEVIALGSGYQVVDLSRSLKQGFSSDELAFVLLETLESAPQSNASVVLAELAPFSIQEAGVGETLL